MALFKIDDRFPNYQDRYLDGNEVKGLPVYTDINDEKVGTVHDILVNEEGRIRYLVLNTGFWVFGKMVLLPIGRCTDPTAGDRIYANELTKAQVENLPEYSDELVIDDDYEEQVRSVYRMPAASSLGDVPVEESVPVETSTSVDEQRVKGYVNAPISPASVNHDSTELSPKSSDSATGPVPPPPPPRPKPAVSAPPPPSTIPLAEKDKRVEPDAYEKNPDLYNMTDDKHHRLRLYEERLVAEKRREKTGEVTVTKRIETEPVEGSLSLRKEKIIIEIESIAGATQVNVGGQEVNTGEGVQTGLYSDQVDVRKESVVRQEVTIRKDVEEEVVTVQDTVRREELDIQQDGTSDIDIVDRRS